MSRAKEYKPLLFTTTLRNPERIQPFLRVLKNYKDKILTVSLIDEISGRLIAEGLYKPRKIGASEKSKILKREYFTAEEVRKVLDNNPQKHKEKGFPIGWASRFDTWFKFSKELGFVYYNLGEPIIFSEIGLKLADKNNLEFLQQAFLNAFVKYQRNNPFRRVLNENAPLILLLQVIKLLNADKNFNDCGISRVELLLLLYWKDKDAESLYSKIVSLRGKYGFSISWEVIVDICVNEIMDGNDKKRDSKSITVDYTDEFIRKMRLTGLISLRGGGRFIDINKNEQAKVDYVMQNYSEYKKYDDERGYFDYIGKIDKKLFSYIPKTSSRKEKESHLCKWLETYGWESIKYELLNLARRKRTKDNILKMLTDPVRLEFLTALGVKANFPEVTVIPNYPVDDEGLPTSTAPGANDTGDIECEESGKGILIEVTMSEGRTQTMMEIWPIERHLRKFNQNMPESICYFVAPSIFNDSIMQIDYVREKHKSIIYPNTIKEFIELIECKKHLYPQVTAKLSNEFLAKQDL